jgi:hypothetical protein
VPWLRSLVGGLSPRRPGFAPGSFHVGFVVNRAALGEVFLRVLRFSPVNISFHRRSSNSYYLGNVYYAKVSRHPRLGTRPTPSSGEKSSPESVVFSCLHEISGVNSCCDLGRQEANEHSYNVTKVFYARPI